MRPNLMTRDCMADLIARNLVIQVKHMVTLAMDKQDISGAARDLLDSLEYEVAITLPHVVKSPIAGYSDSRWLDASDIAAEKIFDETGERRDPTDQETLHVLEDQDDSWRSA